MGHRTGTKEHPSKPTHACEMAGLYGFDRLDASTAAKGRATRPCRRLQRFLTAERPCRLRLPDNGLAAIHCVDEPNPARNRKPGAERNRPCRHDGSRRTGSHSALVRRERSGDARLHPRRRQEGARRRQDLLFRIARNIALARGHRGFPQAHGGSRCRAGANLHAGRCDAGRRHGAANPGRNRRQCRRRLADLAQHLPGGADGRRGGAFRPPRRRLALLARRMASRSRQDLFAVRRAHQGDLHRVARQSDRLGDETARATGRARLCPAARHRHHQRRGLRHADL